jgi:hypothetical protein
LKENIGPVPAANAAPPGRQGVNIRPIEHASPPLQLPVDPPALSKSPDLLDGTNRIALPGAAEIAERNKLKSSSPPAAQKAPAVEHITTAPADKEVSINAAKEISKHHPSLDHLSAPASRIHSGTATPQPESAAVAAAATAAAPAPGPLPSAKEVVAAAAPRQHRGSEVKEVPLDEIKRIEDENALAEEDEDGEEGAEKTQEQQAKEPEDAGKSVGN